LAVGEVGLRTAYVLCGRVWPPAVLLTQGRASGHRFAFASLSPLKLTRNVPSRGLGHRPAEHGSSCAVIHAQQEGRYDVLHGRGHTESGSGPRAGGSTDLSPGGRAAGARSGSRSRQPMAARPPGLQSTCGGLRSPRSHAGRGSGKRKSFLFGCPATFCIWWIQRPPRTRSANASVVLRTPLHGPVSRSTRISSARKAPSV